ncbi:Aromatic-amino-acid aminotransferase 2 [Yarrowia sp. B02]|nr:Aromatic-amino-acid aminotransferase 2 [Yarrowia sp. B02]
MDIKENRVHSSEAPTTPIRRTNIANTINMDVDIVMDKFWPGYNPDGTKRESSADRGMLYRSESGISTPLPVPNVYQPPAHQYPGLDINQSSTGVIWTTERAAEKGFTYQDPTWANLGQGAPEVGDIPGCFERPDNIDISINTREYAPTSGLTDLRKAVANLYNEEYRQDKASKYTYENVCIVPGGRAGLIRIAAILKDCYMSFFFPDYTAYSEMLSLFKNFAPIPVPLDDSDNYQVHLDIIESELNRGVSALLTSNPRNPTGQALRGADLKRLQDMCRKKCLLIMDEFYSRYNYEDGCNGESISCCGNIEDVNVDPVLILDGLTKAFRLPGWRICWILGPKKYINALASAGSYLDGGGNAPFQAAAIPMLEPSLVKKEMTALQRHFVMKRDYCIDRLTKMGFVFKKIPTSTFYLWVDLSNLPGKLSNTLGFFQECLKEKVIVVPGIFFDLNPLARRELDDSPYYHFVRLSYGPDMDALKMGMDGIEKVIQKHSLSKAFDKKLSLADEPARAESPAPKR